MPNTKSLTLHIGLPKTATTTLQTHVFPQVPGYLGKFFGHMPAGEAAQRLMAWRGPYAGWREQRPGWEASVGAWIASLDDVDVPMSLVSEEGFSSWPVPGGGGQVWPFLDNWCSRIGARPHPVVKFIAAIRAASGGSLNVRVILTLRNQPDLMGSLYAQLQGAMRSPSQDDFEAKVARAVRTDDPFFDYATFVEELEQDHGDGDLLILLHEDGLERNVSRIAEFLGLDLAVPHSSHSRENVKRHGPQSWKGEWVEKPVTKRGPLGRIRRTADKAWPDALRVLAGPLKRALKRLDAASEKLVKPQAREGVVVTMPDRLAREVREHYAGSNERLARRLGRDLQALGY